MIFRRVPLLAVFTILSNTSVVDARELCSEINFGSANNIYSPVNRPDVSAFADPKDLVRWEIARVKASTIDQKIGVQEFLNDLRGLNNKTIRQLLNIFSNRQYTFAMDRSSERRMDILADGFRNLYETQRSSGIYKPNDRSLIESLYLGLDLNDYLKLEDSTKPKSMYLIPNDETGIKWHPTQYFNDDYSARNIGDTWVFKLDAIENNVLFTLGDSLNSKYLSLTDPPYPAHLPADLEFIPDIIASYPLPLEWLSLTIPYFYEQVQNREEWQFTHVDPKFLFAKYRELLEDFGRDGRLATRYELMVDKALPDFEHYFLRDFPQMAKYQEKFLTEPRANYIEGLYYGKLVVPGMIAKLIYRSHPPTPAEQKILESLGVEVIDGRQGKSKVH